MLLDQVPAGLLALEQLPVVALVLPARGADVPRGYECLCVPSAGFHGHFNEFVRSGRETNHRWILRLGPAVSYCRCRGAARDWL